ncbi:restriction endonuclease S subunits [Kyrpidia tusciae DSM 2912]|uniref:Restriction endonuclease S subunits n=1 Tax=Kyrpidia tusciae (strain DSM 2912 / NBRC 15312 / T2) TaxID=562970 RepID=D5WVQ3_KYRT2|nr:restriction endonuclease S subunits [Kyrpidia tusciae DSM 2912]
MTEGPYKLPEGWRWVRLGEVCQCERRTVDPRRSPKATFYLYSIPAYDESQRPQRLDGSQIGSSKVVIGPGVCLFSKLNPRIPRAWVVAGVPQDGMPVASTEFMPLRPNPNVLDLDYLGKLLMTEWFVSQVRLDVTGATGSRQRLKPGVILNALIPLPPLDEQGRIVAHLEAVQEKIRAFKSAQSETDQELRRLEQSMLDKAFRGEL